MPWTQQRLIVKHEWDGVAAPAERRLIIRKVECDCALAPNEAPEPRIIDPHLPDEGGQHLTAQLAGVPLEGGAQPAA